MDKKKLAAAAAAIAYMRMEKESTILKEEKKKAYETLEKNDSYDQWHGRGIRNIMAGKKLNIVK